MHHQLTSAPHLISGATSLLWLLPGGAGAVLQFRYLETFLGEKDHFSERVHEGGLPRIPTPAPLEQVQNMSVKYIFTLHACGEHRSKNTYILVCCDRLLLSHGAGRRIWSPLDNLLDKKNGLADHLTALFLWPWQKNRQKRLQRWLSGIQHKSSETY